jgi:hypothetical protein
MNERCLSYSRHVDIFHSVVFPSAGVSQTYTQHGRYGVTGATGATGAAGADRNVPGPIGPTGYGYVLTNHMNNNK